MKRLILLLSFTLFVGVLFAQRVSESEALQKAQAFMQEKCFEQGKHFSSNTMRKAPGMGGDSRPYYVFNVSDDGGFVIVSGDDRTVPVLGYSTRGSVNSYNMPDNLREWLREYERQLKWMDEHDNLSQNIAAKSPVFDEIEPLLTSTWNQGSPYNGSCPTYSGSQCVTGCLATAMAQVMYYHKWPSATTSAIPSYTTEGLGITVPEIASGTMLNWDDMLPSYTNISATSAQQQAVAQLMYLCGASVQMDYTPKESGASGYYAAAAFRNYFDYNASYVERDNYSYDDWVELIYDELYYDRPVEYNGQSSGGGHAFVIDGYKDGLFHVNWGWGGHSDGYFVLSILNPGDNSGIGASSSKDGYSFGQDAIIGVEPANGSVDNSNLQMSFTNVRVGGNVITYSAYNLDMEQNIFSLGIGVERDGKITPISSTILNIRCKFQKGVTDATATIDGSTLEPGSHVLLCISRLYGTSEWLTEMSSDYKYIEAIVDNNHNVTLILHPMPNLVLNTVEFSGTGFSGEVQTAKFNIRNDGEEFYGPLYLFASRDLGNKGTYRSRGGVTIAAGGTSDIDLDFTPDSDGTWYVWLAADQSGTQVVGSSQLTVINDPYVPTGQIMVSNLTVANADGDWTVDANGNRMVSVYSSESGLTIAPTIKNVSGSNLTGSISVAFYLEKNTDGIWKHCANYFTDTFNGMEANSSRRYSQMTFQTDGYGTYRFVLEVNNSVVDRHYIINYALSKSPVITFADAEVKRICVANWDCDGDGELNEYEASQVTDLGDVFEDNTTIVSFNELEYFIGLEEMHHSFDGCENLESVVIPKNIDYFGLSHPFGWCPKLKNIRVADGNTTYDSRNNCNAIIETATNKLVRGGANTVIPQSVTIIGKDAFSCVANLRTVTLPSALKTIESGAFEYSSLESIVIPASVTSIDDYAFQGTTAMKSMKVEEGNTVYDSRDNSNAIILTASATLISGCSTTVIPSTVKHIGNNAFCNHEELTSMTIPSSVESIGENAFFSCKPLTVICLPASVKTIGTAAFEGCDNLKDVYSYITSPFAVNDVFSANDKATLHVPYGTKAQYEKTDGWKDFANIVEILESVTITAKSYTRVYGDANPSFEYSVDGGTLVGTPVITCEATATSPVGTYDIVIARGTVENEDLTLVKGTLTITKAPLTIAAGTYTKKQGEPLPEFTLTYIGFKNDETKTVLTKQPVVACEATETSAPGEYPVTVSGAEAQNYDITYTNGLLTVTQADLVTITVKNCSREYGDDNPVFEYTVEGGTLTGQPQITCEATATSPVGTYDIVVSQGTVSNYNVSFVAGTLTITKAPLTIKADSYTISQGDALPTFTLTCSGFKNNETAAVLTTQPTVACAATADSAPGNYPIIVSGAEAQNYDISYVNGNLTIKGQPTGNVIVFADATVKALCVANWDTDGDGELSDVEAAAVTSLGSVFTGNTTIVSFDELRYFTGLERIDDQAFIDCSALVSVSFPSGLKSVGNNSFTRCSSLVLLVIPEGVTRLDAAAFSTCTSLKTVKLPSSLTALCPSAFSYCSSLSRVEAGMVTPPDIDWTVFNYCQREAVLIVPVGSKSAYEAAAHWQEFMAIIEAGEDTTPAIEFADATVKALCVSRWDVNGDGELSEKEASCVKMLRETFKGNTEIKSFDELRYFTSLECIDDQAFIDCSALVSVSFPSGLKSVGNNSFTRCSSLVSLDIPEGVTRLDAAAFSTCTSLKTVKLPSSLTALCPSAFSYCSSLSRVEAGMVTPPDIDWTVFNYCQREAVLIVPVGSKSAYEAAAHWQEFKYIYEVGHEFLNGDVNGDGDVDIADAVCIVNHVVGKPNAVFNATAADANNDGDVDIADAVHIVNYVVGKINALARKLNMDYTLPDPE